MSRNTCSSRSLSREINGSSSSVEPVISRLNGELLRELALATDGAFVPAGTGDDGLPIGVQVVGPYLHDITTIRISGRITSRGGCSATQGALPTTSKKAAPVSGAESLMEYNVTYVGSLNGQGMDLVVSIAVPVTTLCPCSREISDEGAHNQRGMVSLSVRFNRFIWIEDLIRVVENSASSEVFSLLKRDDEKFVTENAYQNPMFVEDVVRSAVTHLKAADNFPWYRVEAENFESIHNHSAYALIERDKETASATS